MSSDFKNLTDLTKALDNTVKQARTADKRVRHCPSCGSMRLKALALHYVCGLCEYQFTVSESSSIRKVRLASQKGAMCKFDVISQVEVPSGREGVDNLLKDLGPAPSQTRMGTLDFDD